jgi:hypothetical protein
MGRPSLGRDLQEIEGDPEITGLIVRHEPIDGVEADAGIFEIVDEAGEIAGKTGGVGGRGRNEERLVGCELHQLAADRPAPSEGQPRQGEMAGKARDRRRQRQPVGARLRRQAEEMILLVDVADRTDRRQDRRV